MLLLTEKEPGRSDAGSILRFFPRGGLQRGPWPLPEDLEHATAPWRRVLAEVYRDPASWPASISPEMGMLVHALVQNIRPRVVVETGTCLGISTIWMAAALKNLGEGVVHTFDNFLPPLDERLVRSPLFRDGPAALERRLDEAGLSGHVRVHVGNSQPMLEAARDRLTTAAGDPDVQFAFIDADHSIAGAAGDFRAIEPVLQVGGYVLFHDVFPEVCGHEGPRYLADHLQEIAAGSYQVCDLYTAPTNYGFTILRRTG